MIFTDRSRSELERIQRVWDMEECKKLAAKQMFYYANDDRKGMIEELWVREPENAKTASFGRNWGFYLGMDEIERYFVECDQTGETGFMANHPMSSCALNVARGGKTAYGLWYCLALEAAGQGEGKAVGYWISELIGMDFIREADSWRIWHMFQGTEMYIRAGRNAEDYPAILLPDAPVFELKKEFVEGKPTREFTAYTEYQYRKFPPLPLPHETYSLEQSCSIEANPFYRDMNGGKRDE